MNMIKSLIINFILKQYTFIKKNFLKSNFRQDLNIQNTLFVYILCL